MTSPNISRRFALSVLLTAVAGSLAACRFVDAEKAGHEVTGHPMFENKDVTEVDLAGYQTPHGLLMTFKEGTVADPYFGMYALEIARRGGLSVQATAAKFIEWGLKNQKEDGAFERYSLTEGVWTDAGKSDSDDATLARWMQLLARESGHGPLSESWQDSFERAEKALSALRMPNGVYSVFPKGTEGYEGYALFKDNVEVYNVLKSLSYIFSEKRMPVESAKYRKAASSLKASMEKEFGKNPFKLNKMALGADYDQETFYPFAVATPFAWMEGYFSAPTPEDWDLWLKKYKEDWYRNAETDFPWGLVALSALESGPLTEVVQWLEAHRPLRESNTHWNILEEVCAQVIEFRLKTDYLDYRRNKEYSL